MRVIVLQVVDRCIIKYSKENDLLVKKIFRVLIYLYFSWISVLFLIEKEYLSNIVPFLIQDDFNKSPLGQILNLFKDPDFIFLLYPSMILQLILLITGIFFNIHNRFYALICFFVTVNIMNTLPDFLDGGPFCLSCPFCQFDLC